MRSFCALMALAAIVMHPAGAALAADIPPFEMGSGPQGVEVELGETMTFGLSFSSEVDPEELVGLLEARKVGGGADPVRLVDFESTGQEGVFGVRIMFPTSGTWEVVAFPDVADRAALLDAGYPDRITFVVRQPPPGWILPIAVTGVAVLLAALALAGGAWRSRPVVAPWDRTGKPGNRFSREPR